MQIAQVNPDFRFNTVHGCEFAEAGLFIHDIDPLVPETPEDFYTSDDCLIPGDPSPANQFINDTFSRGS